MCQKAHPDRRLFCVRVQRAHVAAAGRSKSACTACQRRGGHAAAAINETKTLPHVAAIPSPACGTVRHEIRPSAKQSVGEAPALAGRRIRRRLRRAARYSPNFRPPALSAAPPTTRLTPVMLLRPLQICRWKKNTISVGRSKLRPPWRDRESSR